MGIFNIGLISFLILLLQPICAMGATPSHLTDQRIIRGIERLYNWEFEAAEASFRSVIKDKPDHPIGYFYLSMVTWSQLASGYWSEDVVKTYGKRIDQAIRVARKKIEKEKALPLAVELSNRFRANPRYPFLKGVCYIRMGKDGAYRQVVQELSKNARDESSREKALIWRNRALYLEASYYLFYERYDIARSKLDAILRENNASRDPFMAAWPVLKQGMIRDIEGDREGAIKIYNAVIHMKNGAGAQFLAEKFKDRPAKRKNPFLTY